MAALIEETGCSRRAAAESEGLQESTVREWEKSDKQFSRTMKKARSVQKIQASRDLLASAQAGETAARIFRAKCLDPDVYTERRERPEDVEASARKMRETLNAIMLSVGGSKDDSSARDSA